MSLYGFLHKFETFVVRYHTKHKRKRKEKKKRTQKERMSNTGFKILAKFCQEKEVTEAHKEGILLGMHIMALQTEKWLDDEDHAKAYRTDIWDECGFSGWREIYEHTKGFLEAKQPEDEESDVSDMEVTDDEGLTWEQLKEEMKTNLNETVSDENDEFEVVDKEDEELEWTPYTFENVEYLVGPEADLGRVVLETEDYQPVGVFEDGKIVFEDNEQFENHLQRVRESTIPEDWDEAQELLCSFIKDNYTSLNMSLYYSCITVFKGEREPLYPYPETYSVPFHRFYFDRGPYVPKDSHRTNILGKNMGEVMKRIEALL